MYFVLVSTALLDPLYLFQKHTQVLVFCHSISSRIHFQSPNHTVTRQFRGIHYLTVQIPEILYYQSLMREVRVQKRLKLQLTVRSQNWKKLCLRFLFQCFHYFIRTYYQLRFRLFLYLTSIFINNYSILQYNFYISFI